MPGTRCSPLAGPPPAVARAALTARCTAAALLALKPR